MKPLISIIVPVFNVEEYIDRCVGSIVDQTYHNLEIILIDDGSIDRSGYKCDLWQNKDERIKVIHQKNVGIGLTRNVGIDISIGNYLMFVDADDYLPSEAVDVLYDRIIKDDSQMVIGKHVDVYDDGNINDAFCKGYKDVVVTPDKMLNKTIMNGNYSVSAWAKLYRREVFLTIRYNELTCAEDLWIFPFIIEKCNKISFVNEIVYYYYQRANSIMHTLAEQKKIDSLIAMFNFIEFLLDKNLSIAIKEWSTKAINRIYELTNHNEGFRLFQAEFSFSERVCLFRRCTIKTRIKWLCCRYQFIFKLVNTFLVFRR